MWSKKNGCGIIQVINCKGAKTDDNRYYDVLFRSI